MTRVLGFGLALTVAVTVAEWWAWGRPAVVAGATFGVLATAIQTMAAARVRPALAGPLPELVRRWSMGMGLRLLGVALFAAAVAVDRKLFPPLPSASGYLGVLIPLLFGETRVAR